MSYVQRQRILYKVHLYYLGTISRRFWIFDTPQKDPSVTVCILSLLCPGGLSHCSAKPVRAKRKRPVLSKQERSGFVHLAASSLQTFKRIFHNIHSWITSAHNVALLPLWDPYWIYVITCAELTQVSYGLVLAATSGLRTGMRRSITSFGLIRNKSCHELDLEMEHTV